MSRRANRGARCNELWVLIRRVGTSARPSPGAPRAGSGCSRRAVRVWEPAIARAGASHRHRASGHAVQRRGLRVRVAGRDGCAAAASVGHSRCVRIRRQYRDLPPRDDGWSIMSTELSVLLNPQAVTTTPGSAPVEMSLSVENTSDDVHTYSVKVAGLETGWYTLSAPSVRLFKGTRDRVGLKIHPPRQRGLHKGAYPFRVLVRADDNGVEESAAGTLELSG